MQKKSELVFRYGGAAAITAGAVAVRWLLVPWLGDRLPLVTLYPAIALSAWLGGILPAILSTFGGFFLCKEFFMTERDSLGPNFSAQLIGFAVSMVSCGIVIVLAEQRRHAEARLTRVRRDLEREFEERRTVEDALAGSEASMRLAAEVAGIGTYANELKTGRILLSPEAAEIFGLAGNLNPTPEETFSLIHPDDRERVRKLQEEVRNPNGSGIGTAEFRIVRPNGEIRWVGWRGKTFFEQTEDGRTPFRSLGACIDITPQKTAEEAVRQSEQQLRLLFDALPAVVAYIDRELSFRYFNRTLCEWFGLSSEQIRGRSCSDLLGERVDDALKPRIQLALTGTPVQFESELDFRYGGRRAVEMRFIPDLRSDGTIAGCVALAHDITARHKQEQALRRSEERFRRLVELTSHVVWVATSEGALEEDSPSWRAFTGRDYESWKGGKWIDAVHPDDRLPLIQSWRTSLADQSPYRMEFRQLDAHGEYRHMESTAAPLIDSDGKIREWIGMSSDVTERKRAELLLKAKESRLRIATEAAKLGIFEWNPESDLVLWENRRMYEIFGRSSADGPINNSVFFQRYLLPEDAEKVRDSLATSSSEGWFQTDFRIRRDDGVVRWIEVSGMFEPPTSEMPRRIVGVLADVTERVVAEAALRKSEESHRLLVAVHDATRGLGEPGEVMGQIVVRVAKHFGVRRAAYAEIDFTEDFLVVSRDFADGVPSIAGKIRLNTFGPEILHELRERKTIVIADRETHPMTAEPGVRKHFEAIGIRSLLAVPLVKDGHFVAVFLLGDAEPRNWSRQDAALLEQAAERTWFAVITARAQSALRESRDVLSLAMRGGKMGAWSRKISTDEIWWSRELEEIFGLAPGGFQGTQQGFQDLVHPDDKPALEAAVSQALASGEDYCVEFRFLHASGMWRWMEGRGRAVYSGNGEPEMLYGLAIDITARREAEEALLRLNTELSEADRRKDEFLATLAHELRNPLAPIKNALHLLLANPAAATGQTNAREIISRQVTHLTRLVDDLLEVSRITRGKLHLKKEAVLFASIVESAVESSLPHLTAGGITLEVSIPPEPVEMLVDPTRLSQVFGNLLNNAAKFTSSGGKVQLVASIEGETIVISVKDTGIGISPEQLPRVFDMFAQFAPALERAQGGLGIGLSLARGLVELHGGTISASSEGLARGSEFTVRLPIQAGEKKAGEKQPARSALTPSLRVLVVDDNRDAADSLSLLLQLSGHEVKTVYDGQDGVNTAADFRPHAALFDIGLPKMNGYEAARFLREQAWGKEMLLIAVTGWGQEDDKRKARDAGFDHHLTKPVDPEEIERLLAAIHRDDGSGECSDEVEM